MKKRKSRGMTLVELLIAMGLSAMIMASTFLIVRYSASTYDSTAQMVHDNNNSFDAVSIINNYIRSSYYCSVSDSGETLYVTVSGDTFGGDPSIKRTIRFAYDDLEEVVFIDRMDGNEEIIVSEGVISVSWECVGGGIKYKAMGREKNGNLKTVFTGFAYKRGQ